MEMEDYKSNSHKSKEGQKTEKRVVEKAISGTAKTRKKSELKKFTDVFIAEDVENVKTYVLVDVLIPAVKKAISDIVTNGIDMILYGSNGGFKKDSISSKISYRNYYDKKNNRDPRDSMTHRTRTGYNYDDVVFDNRGEAEEVLSRMDELIATYNVVSVGDMYDLCGITPQYTDNKYGWTNIQNASVVRIRDGYVIKMPRAMPID